MRPLALVVFVMLTAAVCLVAEIVYDLVPRWVGYSSLALMALAMAGGVVKVIPTAQRLASGKDPADTQTRLIHGMFPSHVGLLVCILLLAAIQLSTAGTWAP